MLKKHIDLIKAGKEVRFYQSKEWKHKRKEILKRDNFECVHCKEQGLFSKADCVHHIVELKDNIYLGLTNNNLVSLCNSCHNKAHPNKLIKARGYFPSGKKKTEQEMKSIAERLDNTERW